MDEPNEFGRTVVLNNAKDVLDSLKRFDLDLKRSRYRFNEIDLKYFNDVFKIYTTKCYKMCTILEMMAGKIEVDHKLFERLDIQIVGDKVSVEDFQRVHMPMLENYELAKKCKEKAEDYRTYLNASICFISMARDGVSYGELLPVKSLQNPSTFTSNPRQYIPLTKKQEKQRRDKMLRDIESSTNSLFENL